MTLPLMLSGVGLGGAYSVYAAFALISLFLVLKCVRETKGIELEAMQG
jgi:SP family sugar:H+ symporter-like MFS transporter